MTHLLTQDAQMQLLTRCTWLGRGVGTAHPAQHSTACTQMPVNLAAMIAFTRSSGSPHPFARPCPRAIATHEAPAQLHAVPHAGPFAPQVGAELWSLQEDGIARLENTEPTTRLRHLYRYMRETGTLVTVEAS